MINAADLLAAQGLVRNASASDSSQRDSGASGAPDSSAKSVEQDVKRAPELTLSNGRYYLTNVKK